MQGKVYLVGAGPGDPGLITVRGLQVLRQAEVVIYDYLIDLRLLKEARQGAELICCDLLSKQRHADGFGLHQEKINNLIVHKARQGKKVLRLKNGDVSIFSRLSQELGCLLKNKIEYEIIPGVTAASAASALSGIPLTDRRFASSVVFVTGHESPDKKQSAIDWDKLSGCGTIVLYMGVENLSKITAKLIACGKSENTPCAIIQDASLLTQKVLSAKLKDIAVKVKREKIRPPAIVIIGEVAKLERDFNWLKINKKILFTGLSKERFFLKGKYFHLPLINIEPLKDYREFDSQLKKINTFDWIAFSSRYAVEYFFKRLKIIGKDTRALRDISIAAIGNSTQKRLEDFGVLADLVAKEESAQGLLKEFKQRDIRNQVIFLPRSDISDKGLSEGLKKLGARVVASVAYRNIFPKDLPDLDLDAFDEIMFTSPSGVRNFIKRYKHIPKKIKISCIGEVTKKEAKRCHLLD